MLPSSEPDISRDSSSERVRQVTARKWAFHLLSSFPLATCNDRIDFFQLQALQIGDNQQKKISKTNINIYNAKASTK